jgi:hypothetical protein
MQLILFLFHNDVNKKFVNYQSCEIGNVFSRVNEPEK